MRAYLDTVSVIYLIENVAPWEKALREFEVQASDLTRMECRMQPMRNGNAEMLAHYETYFASIPGGLIILDAGVFEKATELRARWNLKTPDALHLAAAICEGCDIF